jgi:hypothetical protein
MAARCALLTLGDFDVDDDDDESIDIEAHLCHHARITDGVILLWVTLLQLLV